MQIFEVIMLVCFGAAWPVSIYKSYKSGKTAGKSVAFLYIIVIGYISGIIHKMLHSFDYTTWLYLLNALMVSADIILYYRNKANEARVNN